MKIIYETDEHIYAESMLRFFRARLSPIIPINRHLQ